MLKVPTRFKVVRSGWGYHSKCTTASDQICQDPPTSAGFGVLIAPLLGIRSFVTVHNLEFSPFKASPSAKLTSFVFSLVVYLLLFCVILQV